MDMTECFENFILSRRLADLSPKTLSDYRQFIIPFVGFVGKETPLSDLTQNNINAYIKVLLDKPLSKSTRVTYIRNIKIFLKWLQSEYTVAYDYRKIKVPKSAKKNVKIYTPDELENILQRVTGLLPGINVLLLLCMIVDFVSQRCVC